MNTDLSDQVCEKLIADNCMPSEVNEACSTVDCKFGFFFVFIISQHTKMHCFLEQEFVSQLQFLERCLELPMMCFKNISKEKVCAKFPVAMADQDNLDQLMR